MQKPFLNLGITIRVCIATKVGRAH